MYPKKIKKNLIIKLLAILFPLGVAAETVVDEAWQQRLQQRLQQSEWVSLVHVESVQSLVNPALSGESRMVVVQGYSYSLSVLQQWKNVYADPDDGVIKMRVDLSDCPLLLALDNDYIVFANRNFRGGLQIRSCQHFIHGSEAAPVVTLLEQLHPSKQSASVNP